MIPRNVSKRNPSRGHQTDFFSTSECCIFATTYLWGSQVKVAWIHLTSCGEGVKRFFSMSGFHCLKASTGSANIFSCHLKQAKHVERNFCSGTNRVQNSLPDLKMPKWDKAKYVAISLLEHMLIKLHVFSNWSLLLLWQRFHVASEFIFWSELMGSLIVALLFLLRIQIQGTHQATLMCS